MISILNSALYEIMFIIPFIKINNNTYVLLYRCLKLKLIELQSDQMQQTERPVKTHNIMHCSIIESLLCNNYNYNYNYIL